MRSIRWVMMVVFTMATFSAIGCQPTGGETKNSSGVGGSTTKPDGGEGGFNNTKKGGGAEPAGGHGG